MIPPKVIPAGTITSLPADSIDTPWYRAPNVGSYTYFLFLYSLFSFFVLLIFVVCGALDWNLNLDFSHRAHRQAWPRFRSVLNNDPWLNEIGVDQVGQRSAEAAAATAARIQRAAAPDTRAVSIDTDLGVTEEDVHSDAIYRAHIRRMREEARRDHTSLGGGSSVSNGQAAIYPQTWTDWVVEQLLGPQRRIFV